MAERIPKTFEAGGREARFPPIAIALFAQVGAGVLVFGAAMGIRFATGFAVPAGILLLGLGFLAAILGGRLGLARWWFPIQVLFPPALAVGISFPIPPWVYLLTFVGVLLVYWNSAGERVPLYLTSRPAWSALEQFLPSNKGFAFVDLGCGIGGTLVHLARRRMDGSFVGIESAPAPFALSWLRLVMARCPNVRLIFRSFWTVELSDYDVVYCFLSPNPMTRLMNKAQKEMRPGSLFISNTFEVPGIPADEIIEVDDRRRTRLHVWRMTDAIEKNNGPDPSRPAP